MIIGKKITLTCAALSALSVAIGGASLVLVGRIHHYQELTATDALPGTYQIQHAESLTKDMRGAMIKHILSKSDQDRSRFDAEISGVVTSSRLPCRITKRPFHALWIGKSLYELALPSMNTLQPGMPSAP